MLKSGLFHSLLLWETRSRGLERCQRKVSLGAKVDLARLRNKAHLLPKLH